MSQGGFKWTPDFWQDWRESSNPYRQHKSQRDRRLVLQALQLRGGDRVLEVGCGYGWISQALWDAARIEWVGVDGSEEMVRRLLNTHAERQPRALVADACGLPLRNGEFDKVVCTGVLMHIQEDRAALGELVRVLRPGGVLVCSINNALSPYSLPVRLWNRRKKGFVQKFRSPAAFRRVLRELGVEPKGMAGDGIVATVPLWVGRFSFPPARVLPMIRKFDEWAADRFAWLAYEVWMTGVKS